MCIAKGRHAGCLWVSGGCKDQGREEVVPGAREGTRRKIWRKGYASVYQEKFKWGTEGVTSRWDRKTIAAVYFEAVAISENISNLWCRIVWKLDQEGFPVVKKGKRKQSIFPMIQKKLQVCYCEKPVGEGCNRLIPSPLLLQKFP